ncbi:MAG: serine--tRNA ligase [Parcubacteria group bacterium RIFOXYD2_FULL_52_8]|nr:MAG: serine--tRNA ligase [Parcubacteria group bacterium RIFOXYD2_FULL_52_8]
MLDIKFVRENPELVQQKSTEKGYSVDVAATLALDAAHRALLIEVENLRHERNELAASMKSVKPSEEQIAKGRELKDKLTGLEAELKATEATFLAAFKKIPNMPAEDVPVGASEDENMVVKEVGERPDFAFAPKNHWQIGEARGWIDKERATKVAGARFAYLKGDLVKLEWALMQYAMDILTDEALLAKIIAGAGLSVSPKAFTPVLPPLMIRTEPYDAMDRLEPREERYKIEGEELWLQGSAEHVLGSMHADEIFDEADIPVRYVGFATSFRREAGSYGKDMEGIIRLHQFNKLEMESFSTKETSLEEHKLLVAIQEYFVQSLGLPYRFVMKCTADIGKPNARGVDIDTWLPGQGKYRETHTADYMADYQARRLNTRVRRKSGDVELIHTNDATMSSERPLIAILENYQQEDGSIAIPDVLQPYMHGRRVI